MPRGAETSDAKSGSNNAPRNSRNGRNANSNARNSEPRGSSSVKPSSLSSGARLLLRSPPVRSNGRTAESGVLNGASRFSNGTRLGSSSSVKLNSDARLRSSNVRPNSGTGRGSSVNATTIANANGRTAKTRTVQMVMAFGESAEIRPKDNGSRNGSTARTSGPRNANRTVLSVKRSVGTASVSSRSSNSVGINTIPAGRIGKPYSANVSKYYSNSNGFVTCSTRTVTGTVSVRIS